MLGYVGSSPSQTHDCPSLGSWPLIFLGSPQPEDMPAAQTGNPGRCTKRKRGANPAGTTHSKRRIDSPSRHSSAALFGATSALTMQGPGACARRDSISLGLERSGVS